VAKESVEPVTKSDEEWQKQLTPQQYHVARQKGTERAFTGEYWNEHRDGIYKCVCCGLPLFDSQHKYESGTGWPSFYQPTDTQHLTMQEDREGFMASFPFCKETYVECRSCQKVILNRISQKYCYLTRNDLRRSLPHAEPRRATKSGHSSGHKVERRPNGAWASDGGRSIATDLAPIYAFRANANARNGRQTLPVSRPVSEALTMRTMRGIVPAC
jgi:methionine-R-sulfoxide reductase